VGYEQHGWKIAGGNDEDPHHMELSCRTTIGQAGNGARRSAYLVSKRWNIAVNWDWHGLTVFVPLPEVQISRIEMERRKAESPLFVRSRAGRPRKS
jgi:hypothetical protein